ncbi:uncharacterized protein LOC110975618 [Acanthaster planci]|uniref:Uncharacterized protein LOC110975618 n=1 Tax=Acanthaster planci TaxID=133434 RepID=A0A8B7XVL9_ACAPL|nr:uncharacterized protein LOC110975618 [Acanthaster planci]
MYQPVTEEIPPDEKPPDSPDSFQLARGDERPVEEQDDLPEADHAAVVDDPGVEFSSSRSGLPPRDHQAGSGAASQQQRDRFYLRWEPHYLTTLPGIMKMLQLVITLTALICSTNISYRGSDYLALPAAWKFRVFVFTSVLSLLCCIGLLFCRATNVARSLPIDWLMLDIILSCCLSFLYFVASCMIASASAAYNRTFIVADWTARNKLIAGVVLGYTCSLLYAVHVLGIHIRFKRRVQFRHQLLQVDSGSIDSIQPEV